MTTNINADDGVVSGVAGLKTSADNSGVLALQTNGTTALTVNASQALGVGSTPSYGTSGQVLSSGGSSASPTWVTPSAGALVYISTQTVSTAVATVDFTSGISSAYDDYVVYFENVTPGTNSVNMRLRLYKNGSFQNTAYSYSYANIKVTPVYGAVNSTTQMVLTDSTINNTTSIVNGTCTFLNMNSTLGNRSAVLGQLFFNVATSDNQVTGIFGGNQNTAAATTGFQFYFSSGNINSGTFRLYGVAKS